MRTYLRVGALIFYKNKLVTTKMKKDGEEYYVLPGGGVEDYETIHEALVRELKEELDIDITKSRLVYIRELNIKEKGRGVEFYFLVESFGGKIKKGFDPESKKSLFEDIAFFNLEELNNIVFHPKQLIEVLKKDKNDHFEGIKHLGLQDYP
jgi:ADP-ribose pyrophosphatase YjhB (NUDIX family)